MEKDLKELYVEVSLEKKNLEERIKDLEKIQQKHISTIKEICEKSKSAILADSLIGNTLALREILHITNEIVWENKDD